VNLMSPAARVYAKARLPVVKTLGGTAEPLRLYRNLLSSQPMAFSIAGELRAHPDAAVGTLREITKLPVTGLGVLTETGSAAAGLALYALDGIEAEWFPPRSAHTNDRSGFDLAACLELESGDRLLVSVEVKYTDSFSSKPVDWIYYEKHLRALGLDEAKHQELVKRGCSQVLRQVMITDSIHRNGLAPGVGEEGRVQQVLVVVLAREDDEKAKKVVTALDNAVSVPVRFWSHRDLLAAADDQPALSRWSAEMAERYLPTK
jgi:hypothetical protein